MKRAKILTALLSVALAFGAPLFAQDDLESDMERIAEDSRTQAAAEVPSSEAPDATEEESVDATETESVDATETEPKVMPMSERPKRFIEIGFDVNLGVANNALGFDKLFSHEIVLDIPAIRDKVEENGMNIALPPSAANVFFNVNIGKDREFLGLGVFSKMEGDLSLILDKPLLDFLADGNIKDEDHNHNIGGDAVSVSGGIFMEVGLNSFLHLNRWTFTATPAVFRPLVYIPKSTLTYYLNTTPDFSLGVDGKIDVYTPFSLKDGIENFSDPFSNLGFDITLGAEFGLFDWLYIGGTANHIPIVPSKLHNLMSISGDGISIEINDPLSNPEIQTETEITQSYEIDANMEVRRPLTFDVYAKLQLLDMSLLRLTLKPNLGFTALTASGDAKFNWGVQAELNLLYFLSFKLGPGLNQGTWKHRAGIGFNFRIVELLLEASLQSSDFLASFNANGLGVGLGFRLGF